MNVRWGIPLLIGALMLGLAVGVAAEGAAWRIVQTADGTVYLLKDGARYAIVGDEIGDDELAAYAEAEPIGSALLLSALAPSAQAPAAQVVIQQQAVAEASVEGQAAPPAGGDASPVVA